VGGATRKGLGVDNGGMKPFGVARSVGIEVDVGVRDSVEAEVFVDADVTVRVAVKDGVGVEALVEAKVCDEVGVAVAEEATVEVIGVEVRVGVRGLVTVGVTDDGVLVTVAVGVRVGDSVGVVCTTFAALRERVERIRIAKAMALPTDYVVHGSLCPPLRQRVSLWKLNLWLRQYSNS